MPGNGFIRPSLGANSTLRWPLIQERLDALRPETILELGTGTGGVAVHLASRARYVGVEPDDTSRALAASRLGQGDARMVRDGADPGSGGGFGLGGGVGG